MTRNFVQELTLRDGMHASGTESIPQMFVASLPPSTRRELTRSRLHTGTV